MHTAPYTMQKCKSVGVQSGATRAPSQRSVECRVQSAADRAECKVQNAGCSAECRVQSAECRVQCRSAEVQQSAECKVQGAGCSAEYGVQGAVQSAECRVQCKETVSMLHIFGRGEPRDPVHNPSPHLQMWSAARCGCLASGCRPLRCSRVVIEFI